MPPIGRTAGERSISAESTTWPSTRTADTTPWFTVQVTDAGAHAVTGELDMSTAPTLRAYLQQVIAETDDRAPIVIDLSGVTFTDIIGLDPLLEARWRLAHAGGQLILSDSPRCVTRLLRLLVANSAAQRSSRRRAASSRARATRRWGMAR